MGEKLIAPECSHACFCAKCGAIAKSGDPRWFDDFFMPERCGSCGDYKSRYGWHPSGSQWVESFGCFREVGGQPRASMWRPSTWLRRKEWVEFDSGLPITFPTPEWTAANPGRLALKPGAQQ